ncbi:SCO family protein [Mucilaginibacter sp. PAMB04274]|uniref:SCO family protein n=1 Tax=Mucilaginibacter sp. PAMB04274 TaxID=3138568 RepID=UPI0031F60349
MNDLPLKVKKLIILVLILAVPGFFYYLLTVKGKNRYKPLPHYGPKQVAKTGHKFHGKYIPDTIYHTIGNFSLTNQLGKTISSKDFESKVFVVNFFYSNGPALVGAMEKNIDRLAGAYRKNRMVKFVSITVDPDRDTPDVLLKHAKKLGYAADKWIFLTGDTSTIYPLARNGFLENAVKSGGQFIFSNKLILIDADKHIRGKYDGASLQDVVKLNDEIKVQIAEELRKIKAPN